MSSFWNKLFPSIPGLIQAIEHEFKDNLDSLPGNYKHDLPEYVAEELIRDLVRLTGRGMPMLFVITIIPFCTLVWLKIPEDYNLWLLIYVGASFLTVTIGHRIVTPRLPDRLRLPVITLTSILLFFPFGAALAYYIPAIPLNEALVLITLVIGVPSVIPPFIASHRRLFMIVAAILIPVSVFFAILNPHVPGLWPLAPAMWIYLAALGLVVLTDNTRRKRAIITNFFLQSLNTNYEIMNKAYVEANHLYKTAFDQENILKTRQDGDYFITASLIAPLAGGNVVSREYEISTFSRAKTQFRYGNNRTELGGDLNIVDAIFIGGRRFLVVMNSDAMGKSMQGAGGALVLGTTFRMILERSKSTQTEIVSPSNWLIDTVTELNDVFSRFQGMMLISMVLGLLEERTGRFQYINAEHPYCVLLDGEETSFLETEITQYKVGSWLNDKKLTPDDIITHHFKPGQCLVIGSDGRDDLRSPGNNVMGDDPRRILELVKRSKGSLPRLYREVCRAGKPTDDISFISVRRVEQPAPAPTGGTSV